MSESFGMPGLRAAAAASGGGGQGAGFLLFKVADGHTETVRFLENGIEIEKQWCWMHDMPAVGKQRFGDPTPCRDQSGRGETRCPACELKIPRKIIGFVNVIWRNGPVYAKRDDGSTDFKNKIGQGDVLAVWRMGRNRLEDLDAIDTKYRGLVTRDFDIARTGTGMNDTRYRIDPHIDAEGNAVATPPSMSDIQLAKDKPNLAEQCVPMSEEDMRNLLRSAATGTQQSEQHQEDDLTSAFARAEFANPFEGAS